ncbi:MAG: DUF86 domain-containing protein [Elusimicrobiota bacterium]
MKREDKSYIEDIKNCIENIEEYTKEKTIQDFLKDKKTIDAVERNFITIGEAANMISKEFQEKHIDIPWRDMNDMRNIVAHEYYEIDYDIIWHTIKEDLPTLKIKIEKLHKDL